MLRSFYVALTGLGASKEWLDITSNNVANANTVGFKKARPIFQDIVLQDIMQYNQVSNTVNHKIFGGGVRVGYTYTIFYQGPFKVTGLNTDLAIEGDGFFILEDNNGARYYTRDGQLRFSSAIENGREIMYLVHNSALKVLGKNLETGAVEPIKILSTLPPKATTQIYTQDGSNLDPRGESPTVDFDPNDATTFNLNYTINVFDTDGVAHEVGIFFKKVNPKVYDNTGKAYYTYVVKDTKDNNYFVTKDSNGNFVKVQYDPNNTVNPDTTNGELVLVANDVLVLNSGTNADQKVDIYWYRDANNTIQTLAYDGTNYYELSPSNAIVNQVQTVKNAEVLNHWETFITMKDNNGDWVDIVSTNGNVVPNKPTGGTDTEKSKDGKEYKYALITFNNEGAISGDNKIELDFTSLPQNLKDVLKLTFVNLEGLSQYPVDFSLGFQQDGYNAGRFVDLSIGEDGTVTAIYSNGVAKNLYRIQLAYFKDKQNLIAKGSNLFTVPSNINPLVENAGVSSRLRSGTLELSNVDVAEELVNMITAEKAYQANAKVVQTGQTILDTTINLKR